MGHFSTRQGFFMYSSTTDVEEHTKLLDYLRFLDDSGVAEILANTKPTQRPKGGRPEINRYDFFATVVFGFAFGSWTLRDLETSCKFDIRYQYLMRGVQPTYASFCIFINEYILPNTEEIFSCLMRQMAKVCKLDFEDVFLDGTKIEADANKYKFVWKPTTFHIKLCDKIRTLLTKYNLDRGIPDKGIFPSSLIARKLTEFSVLINQSPMSETKELKKQYSLLEEYLTKALEYEEKERICGPDRNSYYKTDHDATAMTLKTDYYSGLGSNMHAAYNVQVAICKGFACAYHVSQSRNDIKELIPTFEQFFPDLWKIPKKYMCRFRLRVFG